MSQATTCRGNLVATCMQHKFAATGETYVYCACLLDRSVMICVCTGLLTCCYSCRIRCIARRSLVGPCRGEVDLAVGELSVSGGSGGTGQCRCRLWNEKLGQILQLGKVEHLSEIFLHVHIASCYCISDRYHIFLPLCLLSVSSWWRLSRFLVCPQVIEF